MNIDARIERRRRGDDGQRLVRDYGPVSPTEHVAEPVDRGPTLERILDHLDPAFEGAIPPNAYVHGPAGSGKSAVVTALFDRLRRTSAETRTGIHTSTRAVPTTLPQFARVDMRETTSAFGFYHAVLDGVVEGSVPGHGVSTDELRDRLREALTGTPGVVVAVDHVDDPEADDRPDPVELFAGLPSNASWLAVGRTPPAETTLSDYTATTLAVDRYRQQILVDILTSRASSGLARGALDHSLARRIAEWADGDAHDALTVLFVAADRTDREGGTRISDADVDAAIAEMPDPCAALGRVLALQDNRRAVLRALVDLDESERASVTATTEAIADDPDVDLSAGTVKRFLYELAEAGIIARVRAEKASGRGRPPSRVELRFPPTAFRRLDDLRE